MYQPPKDVWTIDLNQGYDNRPAFKAAWLKQTFQPEPLTALLAAMAEKNVPINTNICTWRGILTKLMLAPYENSERFHLRAQLYNNSIYLDEKLTPERAAQENQCDARGKRFQYWGSSFESFCTNTKAADQSQIVVHHHEQFCSILKSVYLDTTLFTFS